MAAAEREGENGKPRRRKPCTLDIGHLTEKNLGQLKKLNESTFPVVYKEQFYTDLLKHLEFSRLGYFADVLVASICCRIEDRQAGGKALYIMTLSVLPAYQRHGMAAQLIKWAIDKAEGKEKPGKAEKARGEPDIVPAYQEIQEMYLHVQTSNASALNFYKSFGFEITQEIKGYYKKIEPPDCYVLRRPLNGFTLDTTAVAVTEES